MSRSITILHVEDNPGDARLAKIAMKKAGYSHNVHQASTGQEALDYLQKKAEFADAKDPDLILLDLNLPGIDGWEVLEEIKQDKALRRIPIVVFTSSSAVVDIERSYDLHANSYITKPSDIAAYVEVFRTIEQYWAETVITPSSA